MKVKILIALAALIASCSKSDEAEGAAEVSLSDVEAIFCAEIVTRTLDNSWEAEDEVGIFMYSAGETSNPIYQNVKYISDKDGVFTVDPDAESPILYPDTGSVDFYAYYPYDDEMEGTIFDNETVSQNSDEQSSIDLMLASLKGVEKSNEALRFQFYHQFSKLIIEATPIDGLEIVGDFEAYISSVKYHIEVDVIGVEESVLYSSKELVKFSIYEEDRDDDGIEMVTASAIMVPHTVDYGDVTLTINTTIKDPVSGEEVSGSFSSIIFENDFELVKGYSHTYEILLGLKQVYINGSTIESWGDGELSNDESNMDADKVEE